MVVTRLRLFGPGAVVLTLSLLAGCVGAATEGANIARDKAVISNNMEAAQAGDPEAQYKVGDALCCSVNEGHGFYDTPEAVAWLCRAADQRHGPAMYRLGEIYSGHVVSGVRILRRVAQRVAGSSTNDAIAYAWMSRAEAAGLEEAGDEAEDLWNDLPDKGRPAAAAMAKGEQSLPCEWQEVVDQG